ncbi:cobW-domain-containing protein [Polychaeton citri CBS 116435]|uniref:CobW-domain-containing protein n=1 Tax=Polychaeton citri CBS 116435 TaxID=1314669 RepID=A0A9P4PZM8_9PEZI|nr:cobW-domain-containing protein [Polychaeton citri CBS 116435]
MAAEKRRQNASAAKHTIRKKTKPLPTKALPVTLLSGFLGSGKTTLLQHILKSEHGLRIAVIVNDIGAVNVDANLISKTHRLTKTEEKVIALQNGCICCTLRGDLLEELVRLAELAEFDYVIVESSGISEPEQVAETFDARLAEQISTMGEGPEGLDESTLATLKRLKEAGGLDKFAKLDTTCTVIDAFTMYHDFETADLLSSRRDDVVPEDERTVSDLMVDQIEFADVIVLNKTDMISKDTLGRIRELITNLNRRAKLIESSYCKIDVKEIVNTGMFNLEVAQTGYGWLQDLHAMTLREVNGRKAVTPKPETEEYNVRNFVYVRRRPFHPLRLFKLVRDIFILQQELDEEEDEDEGGKDDEGNKGENKHADEPMADQAQDGSSSGDDSPEGSRTSSVRGKPASSVSSAPSQEDNSKDPADEDQEEEEEEEGEDLEIPDPATILANKRAHPLFAKLFRSKGEFWLASRPNRAGDWSQAGAMLTLVGGRPWFSVIDKAEWETGNPEIDEMVAHDIEAGGKWGDRRQELVFIGEKLDTAEVSKVLDDCLLNDEEWAQWQDAMSLGKSDKAGKLQRPTKKQQEKQEERVAELFDDGFPDWDDDDEDHEGHDHPH